MSSLSYHSPKISFERYKPLPCGFQDTFLQTSDGQQFPPHRRVDFAVIWICVMSPLCKLHKEVSNTQLHRERFRKLFSIWKKAHIHKLKRMGPIDKPGTIKFLTETKTFSNILLNCAMVAIISTFFNTHIKTTLGKTYQFKYEGFPGWFLQVFLKVIKYLIRNLHEKNILTFRIFYPFLRCSMKNSIEPYLLV